MKIKKKGTVGKYPLISIIIPLYNKQDCVKRTLDSVLEQDYTDYEIVVVDDGSTDDSVSVVESLHSEKIKIYKKVNGGPSSARNYGVKKAEGDWILFLDADDVIVENALQLVADNIKNHCFADVFAYNQYVECAGKRILRNQRHSKGYVLNPFLSWFLDEIYPGPGRAVIKRKIMEEIPFKENLRRHEDTDNTFRIMRKYRYYACPKPLFSYNQDTLAASRKRKDYHEDFVCMMDPKGKSFFEQMALYKLYVTESITLYPKESEQIYGDTFKKMKYGRGDKYLKKWKHLKEILRKLIKG